MGGLQLVGRREERRNGVKRKGEEKWGARRKGEGRVGIRRKGKGKERKDGAVRKWEG